MIDRAAPEDLTAKRASVIEAMISSISNHEDRYYFVGLVGYYIEGTRYSASGLSVDLSATPDICRTDAGFTCNAMFPAEMLESRTVKAKGATKVYLNGQVRDAVSVRLEVMIHDVWSVAEFIDGRQHDLFLDPEALESGLDQFWSKPH
ncbi:hypothetical protein [Bradyrhizobium elkanii]|uniref:hypothetical protein n=1 Tax=Bradyrhizobium elkanii TaxID=29448 RepID=UPI00084200B0|nr:hypothetical protein [Bradyrhizobium elkanii]ODM71856.1 hypothetical protein A6452_06380 [Bradyrhizobium elkanii]ODM84749.1 hypothetical protein A6X20_12460 [Bradyrhizobium elkanii]